MRIRGFISDWYGHWPMAWPICKTLRIYEWFGTRPCTAHCSPTEVQQQSMETAWYINDTQLIIAEGKTLRGRSYVSLLQLTPRRDVSAFRRVGTD
jgi:hypothetical protein